MTDPRFSTATCRFLTLPVITLALATTVYLYSPNIYGYTAATLIAVIGAGMVLGIALTTIDLPEPADLEMSDA